MKRKKTAVIVSLALALTLTACSSNTDEKIQALSSIDPWKLMSRGWVDSDLQGSITDDMDIRLQDDFAAAVNKDWKLQIGDEYYGVFQDMEDTVLANMKDAVTDESIEGVEAEVLRKYYGLSSDWDYRNSQGVEPLKKYIDDIQSIGSQKELYAFLADLERNPLAIAPVSVRTITHYHKEDGPEYHFVAISEPKLSLVDEGGNYLYSSLNSAPGLELYEAYQKKAMYMLQRLGYSEKDARKIFKNCLIWEKQVAESTDEIDETTLEGHMGDVDSVASDAGSFPLGDILRGWGFGDTKYLVISQGYAKKLAGLCKESNLEKIKSFLIVNYCLGSALYLDGDSFDAFKEFSASLNQETIDYGASADKAEDELQFRTYIGTTGMLGALNKIYVENYFDEGVTSELLGITDDIIKGFQEVIMEEDWLSEEGKNSCVEKLLNLKVHVAYQNFEILDYSKVSFASKEEGGSFLDAYFAASKYKMYHNALLSRMKYDRDFWDPMNESTTSTMVNAFFDNSRNGIYICAGVCEPSAYSPEMSYEEKMAGIGAIVGHELTHGFDRNGALYDKDGLKNAVLEYKDQSAFNERDDKVGNYYSTMVPYEGAGLYKGSNVTTEATADMGGLRIVLHLAKEDPSFDYDLFFRSYARLWKNNVPLETEKSLYLGDEHPLAFYRINVGLQQFDEFYETYGITEEDKMYLAPEKRIKVW